MLMRWPRCRLERAATLAKATSAAQQRCRATEEEVSYGWLAQESANTHEALRRLRLNRLLLLRPSRPLGCPESCQLRLAKSGPDVRHRPAALTQRRGTQTAVVACAGSARVRAQRIELVVALALARAGAAAAGLGRGAREALMPGGHGRRRVEVADDVEHAGIARGRCGAAQATAHARDVGVLSCKCARHARAALGAERHVVVVGTKQMTLQASAGAMAAHVGDWQRGLLAEGQRHVCGPVGQRGAAGCVLNAGGVAVRRGLRAAVCCAEAVRRAVALPRGLAVLRAGVRHGEGASVAAVAGQQCVRRAACPDVEPPHRSVSDERRERAWCGARPEVVTDGLRVPAAGGGGAGGVEMDVA
jgi:hypothetical protein